MQNGEIELYMSGLQQNNYQRLQQQLIENTSKYTISSPQAWSDAKEIIRLMNEVCQNLIIKGEYPQAERFALLGKQFTEPLVPDNQWKKQFKDWHFLRSLVIINLTFLQSKRGSYDSAIQLLRQTIDEYLAYFEKEALYDKGSLLDNLYQSLAQIYLETRQYEEMMVYASKAIELLEKWEIENSEKKMLMKAVCHHLLAKYEKYCQNDEKALQQYTRAYEIMSQIKGADDPMAAKYLEKTEKIKQKMLFQQDVNADNVHFDEFQRNILPANQFQTLSNSDTNQPLNTFRTQNDATEERPDQRAQRCLRAEQPASPRRFDASTIYQQYGRQINNWLIKQQLAQSSYYTKPDTIQKIKESYDLRARQDSTPDASQRSAQTRKHLFSKNASSFHQKSLSNMNTGISLKLYQHTASISNSVARVLTSTEDKSSTLLDPIHPHTSRANTLLINQPLPRSNHAHMASCHTEVTPRQQTSAVTQGNLLKAVRHHKQKHSFHRDLYLKTEMQPDNLEVLDKPLTAKHTAQEEYFPRQLASGPCFKKVGRKLVLRSTSRDQTPVERLLTQQVNSPYLISVHQEAVQGKEGARQSQRAASPGKRTFSEGRS